MSEEQGELRRVRWEDIFSFSLIFKSWTLARQPSNLILAVAAILAVIGGGKVLDRFWGLDNQYVRANEIGQYVSMAPAAFQAEGNRWYSSRLSSAAALLAKCRQQKHTLADFRAQAGYGSSYLNVAISDELAKYNSEHEAQYSLPNVQTILQDAGKSNSDSGDLLDEAEDTCHDEVAKIDEILDKAQADAKTALDKDEMLTTKQARNQAKQNLSENIALARRAMTQRRIQSADDLRQIRGDGIFDALADHEWAMASGALSAVLRGQFAGGLESYEQGLQSQAAAGAVTIGTARMVHTSSDEVPGAFLYVLMAMKGVCWLAHIHPFYAAALTVLVLAVWSILGGAIYRTIALQATRDEKISPVQALKFAASRFLSFFAAPLLPVIFILVLGLVITLIGLLGNFAGGIVTSVLISLCLVLGAGVTFLAIGTVFGGGLLHPTIAVEGSDCFHALSCSFSYVYTRPFRALFYGFVALLFGALTYLFIRLAVFLTLYATHAFLSWGVWTGGQGLSPLADRIDVIWTAPQFFDLFGRFSWEAMSRAETIAAVLIAIWVVPIALIVPAYLLTYLAGSTTCIYLLLRRKVDGNDIEDAYVDEPADEPLPAPGEEVTLRSENKPSSPPEGESQGESPSN